MTNLRTSIIEFHKHLSNYRQHEARENIVSILQSKVSALQLLERDMKVLLLSNSEEGEE